MCLCSVFVAGIIQQLFQWWCRKSLWSSLLHQRKKWFGHVLWPPQVLPQKVLGSLCRSSCHTGQSRQSCFILQCVRAVTWATELTLCKLEVAGAWGKIRLVISTLAVLKRNRMFSVSASSTRGLKFIILQHSSFELLLFSYSANKILYWEFLSRKTCRNSVGFRTRCYLKSAHIYFWVDFCLCQNKKKAKISTSNNSFKWV